MAQNFIDFANNKHAVAGSSRLRATVTGDIYNIKITTNLDNGSIIGRGDYAAPEYYKQAAATTFAGKIIEQAANGNYYVEVTEATNAYLVLQVPLTYYEFSTAAAAESTFYNAAEDIVRCYQLFVGDVFELSAEGFTGSPKVGSTVSVASNKVKVGA